MVTYCFKSGVGVAEGALIRILNLFYLPTAHLLCIEIDKFSLLYLTNFTLPKRSSLWNIIQIDNFRDLLCQLESVWLLVILSVFAAFLNDFEPWILAIQVCCHRDCVSQGVASLNGIVSFYCLIVL
jgi:hypothetical protein